MAHCFLFKGEMFVWADKTEADNRNSIRKYGFALKGLTPVPKNTFQGQNN